MEWFSKLLTLLIFNYFVNADPSYLENTFQNNIDYIGKSELLNQLSEKKLDQLDKILTHILVQPWPNGLSPLLYIENDAFDNRNELVESEQNLPYKRSRYYRKYPWKRQNSRYDAENRYMCQPSKDDVYRLLVALHEARQGNKGQTVNFCNRKRPASAIFTNIRFLG